MSRGALEGAKEAEGLRGESSVLEGGQEGAGVEGSGEGGGRGQEGRGGGRGGGEGEGFISMLPRATETVTQVVEVVEKKRDSK